jgi:hypothetical protein
MKVTGMQTHIHNRVREVFVIFAASKVPQHLGQIKAKGIF